MLAVAIALVLLILVYTWGIFPALVLWLGRRRPGTARPAATVAAGGEADGDIRPTLGERPESAAGLPHLVVLFSAYNEEAVIAARLANLASLDYPADRVRILVGVDGGTDRTATLAQSWAASHPNVTVVVAERNCGKMAMLKRLVDLAGGGGTLAPACPAGTAAPAPPHLVFTDANTMFDADALRWLVAPLADPAVGGVCGRLVLERGASGKTDERLYWDTESRLKEAESRLDSCLGANGALYAIRPGLFPGGIPDNTIVDDFVIGMRVREQGLRLVFEPRAIAREELPREVRDEWRRRVRIGAGAYQALVLCRRSLSPSFGVFAWLFWSHKVLRWLTPHLMLLGLVLAVVLGLGRLERGWLTGPSAVPAVAGFVVVGGVFAFVAAFRRPAAMAGVLRLVLYFLVMQAALFAGFLRFCRGGLSGAWERTNR